MKTRRSVIGLAFAVGVTSLSFACTGVDSDLFSASGDGGSIGDSDAGKDSGRPKGDAGKSDGGGSSGDAGQTQNDAGVGPKPGVVPALCGSSTTCTDSDPTCCATQGDGLTTVTSYACTSSAGSCGGGGASPLPIACRDDGDCTGGLHCCGELVAATATGGYQSVSCESSCVPKDGVNFTTHVSFCESMTTPASCSSYGLTCQASTILPGFIVCGGD